MKRFFNSNDVDPTHFQLGCLIANLGNRDILLTALSNTLLIEYDETLLESIKIVLNNKEKITIDNLLNTIVSNFREEERDDEFKDYIRDLKENALMKYRKWGGYDCAEILDELLEDRKITIRYLYGRVPVDTFLKFVEFHNLYAFTDANFIYIKSNPFERLHQL